MAPSRKKLIFLTVCLGLGLAMLVKVMGRSPLAEAAARATEMGQVPGVLWSFDFISETEVLMALRNGQVYRGSLTPAGLKLTQIQGVPAVHHKGQGGLLDLRLDPDFEKNTRVFLTFSRPMPDGSTTAVASALLGGASLTNLKILFSAEPAQSTSHHYGSRLAFGEDGFLYLTVGDRGQRHMAQKLDNDMGKVHRIALDGSVPESNPFYNEKGARKTIYSYGHRNPQGLAFHPKTGKLYAHEHGPRGGDELNEILPGKNYGWPEFTYGREYHGPKIGKEVNPPGMVPPLHVYVPSIAPCGFDILHETAGKSLAGVFVLGALAKQHLNLLTPIKGGRDFKEERWLKGLHQRIRSVRQSPKGTLYIGTDSGGFYRVDPS